MRTKLYHTYKGVILSFLDFSDNPTSTFKDIMGCVTIAHCLQNNIKTFCYQSSGNTAMSFARYANHVGIKTVLFYPKKNAYKIDETFLGKNVTTVEFDGSEVDLKGTFARFSKLTGIPVYPSFQNQIDGNKIAAYFLHENFLRTGKIFDWHVQSLSSGFGPYGYFEGFGEIMKVDPNFKPPKFMGVQQEAVCPYVRKFGSIPGNLNPSANVIEPTLFRTQPTPELFGRMDNLLTQFGGRLEVLLNNDYYKYHSFAIHLLQKKNIELHYVTTNEGPILSEAAPVICLSAVLKAIDDGKFKEGTNILISVTGGSRKPPTKKIKPQYEITPDVSNEVLLEIGKEFKSKL